MTNSPSSTHPGEIIHNLYPLQTQRPGSKPQGSGSPYPHYCTATNPLFMSPPPAGALPVAAPTSAQSTAQGADSTSTQHTGAMDVSATQTEQTRQDLELKLQELIECLLELSITVYDFQTESGSLVHQKIQELITQLSDIEGFKDKLDMMVPWEVLSYIEDGNNPDLFSKTFVEAVAGENQFTNGKITALKSFEAALDQNLKSSFPEETAAYTEILKEVANGSIDPGVSESSHS